MQFMMDIKEKTSLLHATTERTGYIKKIMDGVASVEGYAEYLYNLEKMYAAIENALDQNEQNEVVKPFLTKELYRSKLIIQDLESLLGEKLTAMKPLASTEASVARIEFLAKTQPHLVVAHAYTRFLADLFGGRMFFSLLSSTYKIKEEALNYYQFPDITDLKEYVMKYHTLLVNMKLSEDQQVEFINEINNAYIYNLAISNELDVKLSGSDLGHLHHNKSHH